MDKSWMLEPRSSSRYFDGLKQFLNFSFHNAAQGNQILCPCKNCNNCVLSQVLGKDRHGYVRIYGKGVVPSDLWGSRSQLQTQKVIDEVKRNAQEEIRSIQEKMEEEMKVKLQEQVEAIKTEMLGGFKLILTQLQNCFPGVVILDLSSMTIPNLNEGKDADQNIPVMVI